MADSIAELVETFKQDTTYVNSTYSAIVSQVDNTGTVWVYLAGSSIETPTASTSSEVHAGDHVTVEWRNNKLYIAGNYSNPSAGVVRVGAVETVASNAQAAASVAFTAANNAQADADRAHAAADEAEGHAQTALTNAGLAATAASNAQTSANNAQTSADSALVSLATVEDVVGVLNWITAHGTMTANGSTALDPTKVYFVRDNNGDYTVGSYNYSIVSEPKAEDRTSYYTLSVDESVQNYVATHVTVNSEGMWLIPDQNGTPTTNGKKILIATGAGSTYTTAGTYIIDRSSGTNTVLASFTATGAQVGKSGSNRALVNSDSFQLYDNSNVKYFEVTANGLTFGSNTAAKTSDIPTNVSDLNNDSGYQTASDVSGTIVSETTLYYASSSTTAPAKPSAHVSTNSASTYGEWNIALPTYSATYPYLYVCTETKTKGNTYAWTSVEQTTYTSAVSGIKITAENAATTATSYITDIGNDGIRVHDANTVNNSLVINSSGVEIFKGGTASANSVAQYGDTARVGKEGSGHTTIAAAGMKVYGNDGTVELTNLGYGLGTNTSGSTENSPYYTLGKRKTTASQYSASSTYAVGDKCVYGGQIYVCKTAISTAEAWNSSHWSYYIGNYSMAEGYNTTACGGYSHAEGSGTTALASNSHAEGADTIASGSASHAEGTSTTASAITSHAEGTSTTASGTASHAEGNISKAVGDYSHAEGSHTEANGNYSHSSGQYTIANGSAQTAIGKYNVADTTSLFIIGKGTADNARSNALTVDVDGATKIAGDITVGGHGTAIGYTNSGSGTKSSMSSGTTSQAIVNTISISKGTWVVVGSVEYPSNSTGLRSLFWYQDGSQLSHARMSTNATNGGVTRLSVTAIVSVTGSSSTMGLYGYQSSGSEMNVPYYWSIVRIA